MIHPHEITIGSLLRTTEGEIIRVETITSKSKHRKVGYHPKDRPTYMRYVRLAQCEGIELTPEILEKIGFEKKEYGDYILIDGNALIGWKPSNRTVRIILSNEYEYASKDVYVPCEDIHTMQHALRLCGLNELADNFKI